MHRKIDQTRQRLRDIPNGAMLLARGTILSKEGAAGLSVANILGFIILWGIPVLPAGLGPGIAGREERQ